MIKYNSLFPSILYNLKKLIYLYIPYLLILSYFFYIGNYIYWLLFFLYALILEIIDYYPNMQNSIITIFVNKLEKILKIILSFIYSLFILVKTWSIIWILSIILFFILCYYREINILEITNDTKNFAISFLSVYIWIFWVLLWLWLTTQQRTLDKYNDVTSYRIFKYLGLSYIFIYILLFILSTFLIILISKEVVSYSNSIINYNSYYFVHFFILTIVFILLSKNFFYASTSKWVMDIFSSYLIKLLKSNSTKNFLKQKDRIISLNAREKRSKMISLYTTFLFKTGDFLFWKPLYPSLWYYKWNTEQILIDDTKILFRIWLSNIENKNSVTFKYCLDAIDQIFDAYLNYWDQYNWSDKFSLFLQQEIEALFKLALEKDYQPELLELIVKFLSNIILKASKVRIKNLSQHTETGIFERMLKDFFILSWSKKNSSATTLIIINLKSIWYSYIEQNKYKPALSTINILFEIWLLISTLEYFWWRTVTKHVIGHIINVYYKIVQFIIYDKNDYISLQNYEIEKIYKNLKVLLKNFYVQAAQIDYSHRLSMFFYDDLYNIFDRHDESRYRPIYDYFKQIVYEIWITNKVSKKKFLYQELSRLLDLFNFTIRLNIKEYYEYQDYSGFFYNIIYTMYILFIYETDDNLRKILLNTLETNFSNFFKLKLEWIWDFDNDTGNNIYSTIVIFIIWSRKDNEFLKILLPSIINILENFSNYNDTNDLYWHNREYLYKYILFITSWIFTFHFNLEIYKTLEKFLYENYRFKKEYWTYSWWSFNEWKFSLYNFPSDWDEFSRWEWKIWQSNLNCFRDNDFKLTDSWYKIFCDYMNTERKL